MEYDDDEEPEGFGAKIAGKLKAAGLVVGGLLVLGMVKVVVPVAIGGAVGAATETIASESGVLDNGRPTKQDFAEYSLNHEIFGPSYRAMQKYYPEEFDTFMVNAVNAQDPKAYGFDAMKRFRIEKGSDLAQAPTEKVLAVLLKEQRVLEWMAERSDAACADMAFGTATSNSAMPAGAVEQFAEFLPSVMEASGAGKMHPVGRDFTVGSEPIVERYAANLAESDLTDEQYYALLDGSIMQMPDHDRCKVGLANYEAIANLPAEDAAYFYGMLSAQGAGSI